MTASRVAIRQDERNRMNEDLRAETVTVKGASGTDVPAYLVTPVVRERRPAVVVIHHMPGYDWSTKEMVRRFGAHEYLAIMPNLHYHDAPGAAPDDAAAASRAAGGVPDDRLVADVAGAIEYVKGLDGWNGKVAVIGHCSGGRQAFLAGCRLDVDAVVDCYGAFVVGSPPESTGLKIGPIVDLTPNLSAPLLGLFGAEDAYPNPEHVAELEAALKAAGKEFEFHTFDGAGHAFFSVDRPNYRVEAANRGWELIFEFFGKHLSA
jgi:carboxymethylenebutenolidase